MGLWITVSPYTTPPSLTVDLFCLVLLHLKHTRCLTCVCVCVCVELQSSVLSAVRTLTLTSTHTSSISYLICTIVAIFSPSGNRTEFLLYRLLLPLVIKNLLNSRIFLLHTGALAFDEKTVTLRTDYSTCYLHTII